MAYEPWQPSWSCPNCGHHADFHQQPNGCIDCECRWTSLTHRFNLNGGSYDTDSDTLDVLRTIVPAARETGDPSAVAAVMALGLEAGRIRVVKQPPLF